MRAIHLSHLRVLLVIFAVTTTVSCLRFYRAGAVITSPDTGVYTAMARAPFFSAALWGGGRPAAYPLLIKLCGGNLAAVMRAQFLLSIVCWAFLALCCAHALVNPFVKVLGFTLVQALALSSGVAAWHREALSESMSFSLMAACAGSWLLCAHRRRLSSTVVAVLATAAWVFTRDTNALPSLLLAAALLVAPALHAIRTRTVSLRTHAHLIAASIALIIVFAGSSISLQHGKRWLFPFYNNVAQRILPNPARTRWFESRGLPVSASLMKRSGKWASSDGFAFYRDAELDDFREWALRHGAPAYVAWLALHPACTFTEAMRDFMDMPIAVRSPYVPMDLHPVLPNRYPLGGSALVLWAFLAGALVSLCLRQFKAFPAVAVPLFMVALLIPQQILIWHGDAMEIDRHSAQTMLLAKMAMVLLVAFSLDIVLGRGGRSGCTGTDTPRS